MQYKSDIIMALTCNFLSNFTTCWCFTLWVKGILMDSKFHFFLAACLHRMHCQTRDEASFQNNITNLLQQKVSSCNKNHHATF